MSTAPKSFKELIVWQKSMQLAEMVYSICNELPREEMWGLCSQLKRSAVSIPSNIAEGSKRGSRKDYAQFLKMAYGSSAELETQLLLTSKLFQVKDISKSLELIIEVQKMLSTIIKKLHEE